MTIGVVVMAYGTPASADDIAAYYTDVRRGRPPSDEQLAELAGRYAAIGGVSPLTERTEAQIAALGGALERLAPHRYRLYYGAKHVAPRIEDAIRSAAADGVDGVVGLVLAPHYSALSVGEYLERAAATAAEVGLPAQFLERYGADPALIALLAARVLAARELLPPEAREHSTVLFTAHSLPRRILDLGDPYPSELAETAHLVATAAGLERFETAWQSAGRTPEPWLGPDLVERFEAIAAAGSRGIVVCPTGFTSEHLEVLYDLDILAAARAREFGLSFVRTAALNDDPALAALLARHVIELSNRLPRPPAIPAEGAAPSSRTR
jgi:ferrochelatase